MYVFLDDLYHITCREPLTYYQTFAIVEGHTYQISVETITDVAGDTASVTIRPVVPLQPPGKLILHQCNMECCCQALLSVIPSEYNIEKLGRAFYAFVHAYWMEE